MDALVLAQVEAGALVFGIILIALGILILIFPRILNYLVAAGFIILGIAAVVGAF